MKETDSNAAEKLIQVFQARDEWEGNILIGFLRDSGVEATLDAKIQGFEAGRSAGFGDPDRGCGVFVLEHEASHAEALVKEFESAVSDEQLLEAQAAQRLRLDKETIARLRSDLKEERNTFEFLSWLAVTFLVAGAVLWAIWPAWLKITPPAPVLRWLGVVALAVAAAVAGNRIARRMKD